MAAMWCGAIFFPLAGRSYRDRRFQYIGRAGDGASLALGHARPFKINATGVDDCQGIIGNAGALVGLPLVKPCVECLRSFPIVAEFAERLVMLLAAIPDAANPCANSILSGASEAEISTALGPPIRFAANLK